jgi:hypothetical protein
VNAALNVVGVVGSSSASGSVTRDNPAGSRQGFMSSSAAIAATLHRSWLSGRVDNQLTDIPC